MVRKGAPIKNSTVSAKPTTAPREIGEVFSALSLVMSAEFEKGSEVVSCGTTMSQLSPA